MKQRLEPRSSYHALFAASLDAVLLTSPDGGILDANEAACRLLGRTRGELLRLGRAAVVDATDPGLEPALAERTRTGTFRGELRLRRGDGSTFLAHVSSALFAGPGGSWRTSMVIRDITATRQAEEALETLSRLNQGVLDSLSAHLCVLAGDGTIVVVNRAWLEFAAANPPVSDQVGVGANYFAVCEAARGEDAALAQEALRGLRAVARGDLPELVLQYPCHSPDTQRWFVMRATRIRDTSPARVVVAHTDITQQVQAEAVRRQSEERYRMVVEDQTEVICRFRQDGTFTFVNDVYCRFFGKAAGELLGHQWQPMAVAGDVPEVEAELRGLSPTNPVVVNENRVYSGTGQVHWMQFVNRGLFDREGRLVEIQAVGRDITERRRAEDALHQLSGRLLQLQDEERRRLARELHDTTAQELAALALNLDLLSSTVPELPLPAQEYLARAREMAEECVKGVRTLSYLLHPPLLDELGLADAVREYVDGFARRSGLRVDLEIPGDLEWLPRETELALFRVLQEALTNANRHSGSRTVSVVIARVVGEVWLEVRDRGHGMSLAAAGGTEGLAAGTLGVGVVGMRERMRQLGGRLEIHSGHSGTTILAVAPVR